MSLKGKEDELSLCAPESCRIILERLLFELRVKTFGLLCFSGPIGQLSPGFSLALLLTAEIEEVTWKKNKTYQLRHKYLFGQPWYLTWGMEELMLPHLLSRPLV